MIYGPSLNSVEELSSDITITSVANGFVVTMPFVPQQNGKDPFMDQLKKMKEVLQPGDDVLSQIRQQNEAIADEPQEDASILGQRKNIFVFLSFTEVLSFLKYKITDKEK